MAQSVHQGDLFVNGTFYASTMVLASSSVTDTTVQAAANIAASKLEHQYEITYAQESATDAAAGAWAVHVVKGTTGAIVDFRVGVVVAAAVAGNVIIDLLKNGSSILSSTITLDSGDAAYSLTQPAGYSSTALAAGDVLEVKIVSAAATKPKGVFAQLVVTEKAA